MSEGEPAEFAVTNNGYLSTLHPKIRQNKSVTQSANQVSMHNNAYSEQQKL